MREKAGKAGPGFGMWGAAGAMALLALGALTAFLILALDGAMPNWLAALIVGSSTRRSPACSTSAASERLTRPDHLFPNKQSTP